MVTASGRRSVGARLLSRDKDGAKDRRVVGCELPTMVQTRQRMDDGLRRLAWSTVGRPDGGEQAPWRARSPESSNADLASVEPRPKFRQWDCKCAGRSC